MASPSDNGMGRPVVRREAISSANVVFPNPESPHRIEILPKGIYGCHKNDISFGFTVFHAIRLCSLGLLAISTHTPLEILFAPTISNGRHISTYFTIDMPSKQSQPNVWSQLYEQLYEHIEYKSERRLLILTKTALTFSQVGKSYRYSIDF